MSTYEIVAVFRPDLDEEALGAAIDRVNQRIVEHGGTVKSTDRWGKRKTAYPIKKYRDGYYVLTVFMLDPNQVGRIRQTLTLHEDLLRFTVATHRPAPVPAPPAPRTAAPAPAPAPAQSPAPSPTAGDPPAESKDDVHV
jgi:small subunit ribosomal protein S6